MSADASKIEIGAWAEPPDGAAAAKIEIVAWIEPQVTSFDTSKIELVAWIDGGGHRRMSLM